VLSEEMGGAMADVVATSATTKLATTATTVTTTRATEPQTWRCRGKEQQRSGGLLDEKWLDGTV
jgi:hypothetical protein